MLITYWFFLFNDVIMTSDFYQISLVMFFWIFQNIKNNVNALMSNFDKHMFNVIN